jgi:8-oxo-dGTP pyrophosphatase MutT (NUDIX family)
MVEFSPIAVMCQDATLTTLARLRDALQRPLPGLPAQMQMAPVPRPGTTDVSELKPDCRRAGVLVLLYPCGDELYLVLTRRTDLIESHRGQISFPGGGLHPGESAREAALRETEEELGVPPAGLNLLGELSPIYIPASDFCVYPLVAFAAQRPDFIPNRHEVAEVIDVPLSRLLDPATRSEEVWEWRDTDRIVPFYAIGEHKVWGATAMMLCELLTLISENSFPPALGGQGGAPIGGSHESDHSL